VISHEAVWDVEIRQDGDRTVLYGRGELDLDTAPLLLADVERCLVAGARTVVIDLGGMTFLDSTGLGTLVGCWRRAQRAQAEFRLVNLTGAAVATLEITGLDRILPIVKT